MLSVSSIGTNELQPVIIFAGACGKLLFQFPLSERTNCNIKARINEQIQQIILSVSSIGTNELQPLSILRSAALTCSFQFPLSERTNCNPPLRLMQPLIFLAFSFLYRNERTATNHRLHFFCVRQFFQFPLSERTNCNHSKHYNGPVNSDTKLSQNKV